MSLPFADNRLAGFIASARKIAGGGSGPPVQITTWDPANLGAGVTLTGGNLQANKVASTWTSAIANQTRPATSGKFCWELQKLGGNILMAGVGNGSAVVNTYPGANINSWGQNTVGNKFHNAVPTANTTAWNAAGEYCQCRLDIDTGEFKFYDGVTEFTLFSGLSGSVFVPMVGLFGGVSCLANFGDTAFQFTPPAGYYSWDGQQGF